MSLDYYFDHMKVSGVITRQENEQLLALAKQLGVTKSSLVSEAVSVWLERQQKQKQSREGSR